VAERDVGVMRALVVELDDYLSLRRSLGFKLIRTEKLLRQFVDHCDAVGADTVTAELALRWAALPPEASRSWICHRLCVVRGFSRHLALLDERHQAVPTDLVPHRPSRAVPYLYTEDQVTAMMAAARTAFRSPMRQAAFATIVGLLWATGMRIGEALTLDRSDVNFSHGVLTVRETKFGKTRELPVHDTTVDALRAYGRLRQRLFPEADTDSFFLSAAGTRVLYCNFHVGFQELVRRAGVEARSAACRPRPHDLRHSFAVRTLVGWYRAGVDVQSQLPKLSTYLGHVDPAHTYWYLSAAPELLGLAGERLAAMESRP